MEFYNTYDAAYGVEKHSALTYVLKALDLEINGNVKQAFLVLLEGLKCDAQPKDQLEKAQQDLINRVGRAAIGLNIDVEAEQKIFLNKLLKLINKDGARKHEPLREIANNDNILNPGRLTKQQLHQDLQTQYASKEIQTKEDDVFCPVAIFEPVDPTKRVMYCKNKIYTEYSFEELRAIAYFRGFRWPSHKQDADEQKDDIQTPNRNEDVFNCPVTVFERKDDIETPNKDEDVFSCPVAVFEQKDYIETPNEDEDVFSCPVAVFEQKDDIETPNEDEVLNCPVAVFEPPDPSKRPMYCKNKVYSDGVEYSLEELRAKEYFKGNIPRRIKRSCVERSAELHAVHTREETLQKPRTCDIDEFISPVLLQEPEDPLKCTKDFKIKDNGPSKGSYDQASSLSFLCSNSMTCHTKEAMKEMLDLFNEPGNSQKFINKIDKNKELVEEREKLTEPEAKIKPFEIFEDDTDVVENQRNDIQKMKCIETPRFSIFNDEDVTNEATMDQLLRVNDTKESRNEKKPFNTDVTPVPAEVNFDFLVGLLASENQNCKLQDNVQTSDEAVIDASIPPVPSPGYTEKEEEALKGTETKENDPTKDCFQHKRRATMGVLQPSELFPCNPLDDPALKQAFPDDKDYTSCTTAFSYPLVSSTPFTSHFKQVFPSCEVEPQNKEKEELQSDVKTQNNGICPEKLPDTLSTIAESTIEHFNVGASSGKPNRVNTENLCSSRRVERSEIVYEHKFSEQKGKLETYEPDVCSKEQNENYMKIVCREVQINPQIREFSLEEMIEEKHVSVKSVDVNQRRDILTRNNMREVHCSLQEYKYETEESINKCVKQITTSTSGSVNQSEECQQSGVTKELDINPFDEDVILQLLNHVQFPSEQSTEDIVELDLDVPRFKTGCTISVGQDKFKILEVLGEGRYAKVYKGFDLKSNQNFALKIQKPSWIWEFYICKQIKKRIDNPVRELAFMDIHKAYLFNNGSVMLTDYAHIGTLLDVINSAKKKQMQMPVPLMLCWMKELLTIAEELQSCHIIHGDIKPDNIVVRMIPNMSSAETSLQLIDMGRSIDMTLFPNGTVFNTVVTTKGFQCIEMKTNRPWTYQTDLYGIAASMHCVIFQEYMDVYQKRDRTWFIKHIIPRYNNLRHVWVQFFNTLLNIESCDKLPDLSELKQLATKEIVGCNFDSCVKFFEDFMLKKNVKIN